MRKEVVYKERLLCTNSFLINGRKGIQHLLTLHYHSHYYRKAGPIS